MLLRRRGVPILPLIAFPVLVLITTVVTFGLVRYRATAEPSLVILAAIAIDAAITGIRSRTPRREPAA